MRDAGTVMRSGQSVKKLKGAHHDMKKRLARFQTLAWRNLPAGLHASPGRSQFYRMVDKSERLRILNALTEYIANEFTVDAGGMMREPMSAFARPQLLARKRRRHPASISV